MSLRPPLSRAIDWRRLANIEANLGDFRDSPGWPTCYDRQAGHVRCGPGCEAPAVVFGEEYPMCPERWRLIPRWRVIVDTFNRSKISPLSGWPGRYLAWVPAGMVALESAFSERIARAANDHKR